MQASTAFAAIALSCSVDAQPASPVKIYSCIDKNGHHYKSDRLNPECLDKDQQELNPDGSPLQVVPRAKTADEQSADDERRAKAERDRKARLQQQRTDTNLLNRFPDKAAHDKARRLALEDQQASVSNLTQRKALLENEKKKLADEAEFYVGKPMPTKLKTAIDSNQGSLNAVDGAIGNQQQDIDRINHNFDDELAHLRQLWSKQYQPATQPVPEMAPAPTRVDKR